MQRLLITIFGDDEHVHRYEDLPGEEHVLIQVEMGPNWRESEVYDFRLSAPVHEHVLGEVTQLVDDLIHHCVARVGGLQPQLFA
jgi:hypothetical protein